MSENRHSPPNAGDVAQIDEQMCNKSQDELIDDMADRWDAMSEDNFDTHVIDAYLDALNKKVPVEVNTEASLAAFREKHARLFEHTVPVTIFPAKRSMIRNKKSVRIMRLMAAILVVMLACAMTAQALGVDVFGAIARWTDQTFRFDTPAQSDETFTDFPLENEYSDLHDALRAYGVTEMIETNWNPFDFELDSVNVVPTKDRIKIFATYQSGNKRINFSIWLLDSLDSVSRGVFEKDSHDVKLYEISGIEHYIMSNNDQVTIAWIKNNLMCSLSGDFPIEEAETLINSIYER